MAYSCWKSSSLLCWWNTCLIGLSSFYYALKLAWHTLLKCLKKSIAMSLSFVFGFSGYCILLMLHWIAPCRLKPYHNLPALSAGNFSCGHPHNWLHFTNNIYTFCIFSTIFPWLQVQFPHQCFKCLGSFHFFSTLHTEILENKSLYLQPVFLHCNHFLVMLFHIF